MRGRRVRNGAFVTDVVTDVVTDPLLDRAEHVLAVSPARAALKRRLGALWVARAWLSKARPLCGRPDVTQASLSPRTSEQYNLER